MNGPNFNFEEEIARVKAQQEIIQEFAFAVDFVLVPFTNMEIADNFGQALYKYLCIPFDEKLHQLEALKKFMEEQKNTEIPNLPRNFTFVPSRGYTIEMLADAEMKVQKIEEQLEKYAQSKEKGDLKDFPESVIALYDISINTMLDGPLETARQWRDTVKNGLERQEEGNAK